MRLATVTLLIVVSFCFDPVFILLLTSLCFFLLEGGEDIHYDEFLYMVASICPEEDDKNEVIEALKVNISFELCIKWHNTDIANIFSFI